MLGIPYIITEQSLTLKFKCTVIEYEEELLMKNSSIIFFERKFPSANMILIKDQFPILIDTGFGSDAKEKNHY
jgi:hypothetical protein